MYVSICVCVNCQYVSRSACLYVCTTVCECLHVMFVCFDVCTVNIDIFAHFSRGLKMHEHCM